MKRARQTIAPVLIIAAAAVVIASLSVALAAPSKCPAIYSPVLCDNGKIYPNQCYADQDRAKNCGPVPNSNRGVAPIQ
ncbi:MAG: hypothetical protein Q7R41_16620 [Phycisphaerales bacterium]|nr:hypothetical protein [Phycisphaerales bacterium]